jgi:hypothetical protein
LNIFKPTNENFIIRLSERKIKKLEKRESYSLT